MKPIRLSIVERSANDTLRTPRISIAMTAIMRTEPPSSVRTVFMMPSEPYSYVSSRLVKEVARLGGDVTGLVPAEVATRLNRRFAAPSGRRTESR